MRNRPARNPDLHGNVPDDAPATLLLIDVVNDLEFDGGAELLSQALPMAQHLAALRRGQAARATSRAIARVRCPRATTALTGQIQCR